jgi:hypothetical protein
MGLQTTRKDPHVNQCTIAMSDIIIRWFWRHLVPLCSEILKENGIIISRRVSGITGRLPSQPKIFENQVI